MCPYYRGVHNTQVSISPGLTVLNVGPTLIQPKFTAG